MKVFWNKIAQRSAISLVAVALLAMPAAASSLKMQPATPNWQTITPEQAIKGCDDYASHPLDPLKPRGVSGVASDGDINRNAAYIYCHRAMQADQKNPRILFQWGRVNLARNPAVTGQPRQMFRSAYEKGSEIAGVYLAKLPPEQTSGQRERGVQKRMKLLPGYRPGGVSKGVKAEDILVSSLVVITSVALLKILSGKAPPSQDCSGGFMLDVNTHALLCNGLVVGQY